MKCSANCSLPCRRTHMHTQTRTKDEYDKEKMNKEFVSGCSKIHCNNKNKLCLFIFFFVGLWYKYCIMLFRASVVIVQGKGSGQRSLVPSSSQELPELNLNMTSDCLRNSGSVLSGCNPVYIAHTTLIFYP